MTIDTEASVTIVRPDITAELRERKPNRPYILQTASRETLPVMREVLVKVALGRSALRIWVFVAEITNHHAAG
jgi:hypothetical protein